MATNDGNLGDSDSPYKMTISRKTVDKLGINMYDTAPAVCAELVANAYDADAEEVDVEIPLSSYLATKPDGELVDKGYEIKVEDDGHGMTQQQINDFYLPVGKPRREDTERGGRSKEKDRPVMGRKGIGKLAPFGICKTIEVISAAGEPGQDEYPVRHLVLHYDEIITDTDSDYHPPTGELEGTTTDQRGTTIILRDFFHKRTPDPETFKRQLSAKFGLGDVDFGVTVHDTRDGGTFIIEPLDIPIKEETKLEVEDGRVYDPEGDEVLGPPDFESELLEVDGWVALSKDPFKHSEIGGIRIYTRGKQAAHTQLFGMPSGFHGEHTVKSYLVGELSAPWIDREEDLVRTDRKDILWSTPKAQEFKEWGQDLVRELGSHSRDTQRESRWDRFEEKTDFESAAESRFQDEEIQQEAVGLGKKVGGNLSEDELDDEDMLEDLKDLLLSVAPHSSLLRTFRETAEGGDETLDTLLKMLKKAKVAQQASLGQVAQGRLRAIDRLEELIDARADEKKFQALLEEAPWLINPYYTQLTSERTLKTARERFEAWWQEKHDEEIQTSVVDADEKEPDFVLLGVRGHAVAAEIKRPDNVIRSEAFGRIYNYYQGLEDFLASREEIAEEFPQGVKIIVIADEVSLDGMEEETWTKLEAEGALQQYPWDDIVIRARNAHQDFLDAR